MAILEKRIMASPSELRWFGLIVLAASLIFATMIKWQFGADRLSAGVAIAGGITCLVYYAVRSLRLPLYLVWMRVFHPVGWLVSHAILLGIWFLVLTPIGLVLRLVRYDPLTRRFEKDRDSYWERHNPADGAERYFQQF